MRDTLTRTMSQAFVAQDDMTSNMSRASSIASKSMASHAPGGGSGANMLTTIEAVQVSAVVEEALERLNILSGITPDILAHREELATMVGEEITRIIEEQRALEHRYEELIAQRGQLKALTNKSKYKENQAQIEDVARELRQTTKVLCRSLKENPNVVENLLKIQNERSSVQSLLQRTLNELNDCSFPTLMATVAEEKRKHDTAMETITREKEASAAVRTLTRELLDERAEKERELTLKSKAISELKQRLQEIKADTLVRSKLMKKEATARSNSINRVFSKREQELQNQKDHLRKQLEIELRVAKETEQFLNRKQAKIRTTVQEWMERYETDIEEKDRELETLKSLRANDLIKLNDLTEQYNQLKVAFESEHEVVQQRKIVELLFAKREYAATRIQSAWRGYKARKALRDSKKKKGKGKGKGKGKKGKKGK